MPSTVKKKHNIKCNITKTDELKQRDPNVARPPGARPVYLCIYFRFRPNGRFVVSSYNLTVFSRILAHNTTTNVCIYIFCGAMKLCSK